ncbi:MAG: Crp/Fnr family transcriptional regulator [Chloroflexi bacterium]|nr:Crp/Fnr family transcriptional regulator [Chloroflexota bacterium]
MTDRRQTPLEPEHIEPQMCTIDLRLSILHQLPFFQGLSHDAIAAINPLFRELGFEAGETIYFTGDPATRLYVVAAGKVKLLRHAPGGQEVLLDLLVPGDFFGSLPVLGQDTHADTAQAHTMCCALTITGADFQGILQQYPAVSLALLEIVSGRLRAAHEAIHQLSAAPVESRLAATLLKLADKLGEQRQNDVLIQLPLSRQDLADMTGATVETVSRIMSQLRKQKVIRSGRGWVAIADREALAALVEQ